MHPLANLLRKTLGKYLEVIVKDYDRKQLSLSALKGKLKLSNFGLNEAFCEELLDSPQLKVIRAYCSSFVLEVPWRSLKHQPITINIDRIEFLVEEVEELSEVPNVLHSLLEKRADKKRKQDKEKASDSVDAKSRSFAQKMIEAIQINIRCIDFDIGFLPLEDGSPVPRLQVSLEGCHFHSTDHEFNPTTSIRKAFHILPNTGGEYLHHQQFKCEKVTMSLCYAGRGLKGRTAIVNPTTLTVNMLSRKNWSGIRIGSSASVSFANVEFRCPLSSYDGLTALLAAISACSARPIPVTLLRRPRASHRRTPSDRSTFPSFAGAATTNGVKGSEYSSPANTPPSSHLSPSIDGQMEGDGADKRWPAKRGSFFRTKTSEEGSPRVSLDLKERGQGALLASPASASGAVATTRSRARRSLAKLFRVTSRRSSMPSTPEVPTRAPPLRKASLSGVNLSSSDIEDIGPMRGVCDAEAESSTGTELTMSSTAMEDSVGLFDAEDFASDSYFGGIDSLQSDELFPDRLEGSQSPQPRTRPLSFPPLPLHATKHVCLEIGRLQISLPNDEAPLPSVQNVEWECFVIDVLNFALRMTKQSSDVDDVEMPPSVVDGESYQEETNGTTQCLDLTTSVLLNVSALRISTTPAKGAASEAGRVSSLMGIAGRRDVLFASGPFLSPEAPLSPSTMGGTDRSFFECGARVKHDGLADHVSVVVACKAAHFEVNADESRWIQLRSLQLQHGRRSQPVGSIPRLAALLTTSRSCDWRYEVSLSSVAIVLPPLEQDPPSTRTCARTPPQRMCEYVELQAQEILWRSRNCGASEEDTPDCYAPGWLRANEGESEVEFLVANTYVNVRVLSQGQERAEYLVDPFSVQGKVVGAMPPTTRLALAEYQRMRSQHERSLQCDDQDVRLKPLATRLRALSRVVTSATCIPSDGSDAASVLPTSMSVVPVPPPLFEIRGVHVGVRSSVFVSVSASRLRRLSSLARSMRMRTTRAVNETLTPITRPIKLVKPVRIREFGRRIAVAVHAISFTVSEDLPESCESPACPPRGTTTPDLIRVRIKSFRLYSGPNHAQTDHAHTHSLTRSPYSTTAEATPPESLFGCESPSGLDSAAPMVSRVPPRESDEESNVRDIRTPNPNVGASENNASALPARAPEGADESALKIEPETWHLIASAEAVEVSSPAVSPAAAASPSGRSGSISPCAPANTAPSLSTATVFTIDLDEKVSSAETRANPSPPCIEMHMVAIPIEAPVAAPEPMRARRLSNVSLADSRDEDAASTVTVVAVPRPRALSFTETAATPTSSASDALTPGGPTALPSAESPYPLTPLSSVSATFGGREATPLESAFLVDTPPLTPRSGESTPRQDPASESPAEDGCVVVDSMTRAKPRAANADLVRFESQLYAAAAEDSFRPWSWHCVWTRVHGLRWVVDKRCLRRLRSLVAPPASVLSLASNNPDALTTPAAAQNRTPRTSPPKPDFPLDVDREPSPASSPRAAAAAVDPPASSGRGKASSLLWRVGGLSGGRSKTKLPKKKTKATHVRSAASPSRLKHTLFDIQLADSWVLIPQYTGTTFDPLSVSSFLRADMSGVSIRSVGVETLRHNVDNLGLTPHLQEYVAAVRGPLSDGENTWAGFIRHADVTGRPGQSHPFANEENGIPEIDVSTPNSCTVRLKDASCVENPSSLGWTPNMSLLTLLERNRALEVENEKHQRLVATLRRRIEDLERHNTECNGKL